MGIAALILSSTGLVLAWGIAGNDSNEVNPTYRRGVVLGLILTFVLGATSGVVMSLAFGHLVGNADAGSPLLPFVGWSRTVGDLRVPHFMGLHAQQVIAFAGFLVAGYRQGGRAVIGIAWVYTIIVISLFVQALAGHPFLPG